MTRRDAAGSLRLGDGVMVQTEIYELRYSEALDRLIFDLSTLVAGSLIELRDGLRGLGAARNQCQQRALAAINSELADRGIR